MKNTKPKLIEVLRTVDQKEWKSLKRHLLLFTTKETEYYKLIQLLSKTSKLSDIDITAFHKKHFVEMTSKNFYNMMSKILPWVEDWMITVLINKNQRKKNILLVKALNYRGLFNHADKKADQIEKEIISEKQLDLNTNADYHQLLYYQFYSNNPIKYRDGDRLFNKLLDTHKLSYKEYALTYLLEVINRMEAKGSDLGHEIISIKETTQFIGDNQLTSFLEKLEELISKKKVNTLNNLSEILLSDSIRKNTDLHLLSFGYINRASALIWNDQKLATKELFIDLVNYGVESGIYTENGKIDSTQFFNLIGRLTRITTYEKVIDFINKWIGIVESKDPQLTLQQAYAMACFYFRRYKEVLEITARINYKEPRRKLVGSAQKAIALYEEEEIDLLQSHLSNYKRLHKRKIKDQSDNFYTSHNNLIKVIELMIKRKYDQSINIVLSEHLPIFYRTWFTGKLS